MTVVALQDVVFILALVWFLGLLLSSVWSQGAMLNPSIRHLPP